MANGLTYRDLVRQVKQLSKEIARDTSAHRALAELLKQEAQDTLRVAEQISTLKVDSATVAETSEVARLMNGLSEAAVSYATTAEEAGRQAQAAGEQARTDHNGIQEANDRSPVEMADRTWYTQE
ncbi:hypothetical protein [Kitasatospora kifunensis]|uniref:G3E family GTPase n=1 Tax=Kitasatospora kifunensis TaxID=58351 RepID=A0A7W7QYP0_KITKI|nr:hypothetical protein [Kitasatospora kifunensis]MBB4922248.1 G3E family GTPase [Kitasatospora kifunensis]